MQLIEYKVCSSFATQYHCLRKGVASVDNWRGEYSYIVFHIINRETLRSTTRPGRQRGPNFSSKMSAEHFDAVKV